MTIQKGIPYVSIQEPLDEEERALMDPENWDWEHAVEGIPNPDAGAVLRVRFSREEFIALDRMARDMGIGPIALIHQTMVDVIAVEARTAKAATG